MYVWVPCLYYLDYKSCDLDCKNCDLGYKQYDPDYKNFDPYSDPDYRNLDLECMNYDYFDAPVQWSKIKDFIREFFGKTKAFLLSYALSHNR